MDEASETVSTDRNALTHTVPTSLKREPPIETPASTWTRRLIVAAFWTVVVLFGFPHWLWTTSIRRSDLPLDRMNAWADGGACELSYPIHVALVAPQLQDRQAQLLAQEVEDLLNGRNPFDLYRFHLRAQSDGGFQSPNNCSDTLTVSIEDDGMSTLFFTKLEPWTSTLFVRYSAALVAQLSDHIVDEILGVFNDEQASVSYLLQDSKLSRGRRAKHLDSDRQAALDKRSTRAFKYASTYHLTFSLFAASATPAAWQIEEAYEEFLAPLLRPLSAISRYTVDTQVQLFASLSPSIAGPHFDDVDSTWKLLRSDLSGFINAAEWPLSPSIGDGPTLNFVLYIPHKHQTPLVIAESAGTSWVIPQWGGVQILNPTAYESETLSSHDLREVMLVFGDQLASLLGVPPQPASLAMRISSLTRERTTSLMLSASSTMGALARLTLKLTSIAIPDTVARSVDETLSRLDLACSSLRDGHYQTALEHARIAEEEAEKAFFEPSMVGQVYFPDEHKVAVYVPLLGPMSVPLLMTAVKELKALRQRRKVKVI